ncbi:MAG: hypothetical protein LGR52_01000 [Candidatus Thiosymbion ectosymbiont of Robbea hypermnestra]|nr:hypothetical protein [Candidatus Thiosymbion ectosymbiont of Robbea hypermnestra]
MSGFAATASSQPITRFTQRVQVASAGDWGSTWSHYTADHEPLHRLFGTQEWPDPRRDNPRNPTSTPHLRIGEGRQDVPVVV